MDKMRAKTTIINKKYSTGFHFQMSIEKGFNKH